MLERLKSKWGVSAGRVLLILVTFAVGGSLTGYLGKIVMGWLGIRSVGLYIPIYIIVVTIIWPLMVLLVSLVTGQFVFFRTYLKKMFDRIKGRKTTQSR
ncbi:MAG TPA: DUF6787 family protein [Chitinophagaceae bacterium]